jgi:hypothetical protein
MVVYINSRLVTSNDDGDEVGVVFGLFLKLLTDSNMGLLFVIAQQLGHRYHYNALHVDFRPQTSLTCSR